MDKAAARKLVADTFQQPFDKARYYRFVKELLNRLDEASFMYAGSRVPDAYKGYIRSLERIGKYQDPDENKIDILIVHLEKGSSLERARTMQRNFVAWYLNGSRGGELKDAALVAFVSPDSADWRFSLVKMEYKIDETPTGRVRAKAEYTPARRMSFLVGEHETSHTAQSRLVPLIEDDEHNPTLKQIEDAFNIEKATKEFFAKYRDLFNRLVEALDEIRESDKAVKRDFAAKGVSTADFAKKLLGQIVFLYFLQKKGWFGVKRNQPWGEGSKQFLRELFAKKHGGYQNFFNDILEPLFYEALRQERQDDYYSRFDCRIPFLNGGLFDPLGDYDWIDTDILLPNELFSNATKTKEGDTGTGILDVFDRYNFTVNEDEPLEKEVAVDPEMLGKVFENLLEVKDRKSKGTYYTPREIVHYMCQESLINYLATELKDKVAKDEIETLVRHGDSVIEHEAAAELKKERIKEGLQKSTEYKSRLPESVRTHAAEIDAALETIRICDPAVGSGAFPVGMMSEIIRARGALSAYLGNGNGRTMYDLKRHAIQNCLYGVDIDPGAIEIAKLRLWLSLVVDEEERGTIQPLPNLDYKLVCGNSLLGVEEQGRLALDSPIELERLKQYFIEETHPAQKQALRKQIDDLILRLSDGHREFDFKNCFSEVFHAKGGFDVVIANPPYGADLSSKELEYIKKTRKLTNNSNSAAVFTELGISRLLRPTGTLSFIVPKSLLFSEGWFDLVRAMLRHVSILVDVEKAFEKVKLEQVFFLYGQSIDTTKYLARKFLNSSFIRTNVLPIALVEKFQAWLCDVDHNEIEIAKKINAQNATLMRNISRTTRGLPIQRLLKSKGKVPVIGGRNIVRYALRGQVGFIDDIESTGRHRKLGNLAKPKIVSQNIVAHIQNPAPHVQIIATYDDAGSLLSLDTVNNTVLNNSGFDARFVLGLLNSTLLSWYAYRFIYCAAIRTMHFDEYYVGKLPIPRADKAQQQKLIDKVSAMLYDSLSDAERRKTEAEIDQLVYRLYGLTDDEIAVVEGRAGS